MLEKRCGKCGEVKSIEDFNKEQGSKDGHFHWCRSCMREYNRQYDINNPEKKKEKNRKYHINHPEKEKENGRQYRINHREKDIERHRQYRINNREKRCSWESRRKAKIRNSTVENVDLLQLYENHKYICGVCGLKIDKKLKWPNLNSISQDHIIPLSKGGGHTYNNIQPAHLGCNMIKNDKINNIQLVLQTV